MSSSQIRAGSFKFSTVLEEENIMRCRKLLHARLVTEYIILPFDLLIYKAFFRLETICPFCQHYCYNVFSDSRLLHLLSTTAPKEKKAEVAGVAALSPATADKSIFRETLYSSASAMRWSSFESCNAARSSAKEVLVSR